MKICAWCKNEGLTKEEYSHPDDEIGGIDSNGNWFCDDCRDAGHPPMGGNPHFGLIIKRAIEGVKAFGIAVECLEERTEAKESGDAADN